MVFRDDDRGQSVQVGAVLLFAVLVILLATYQSTVVPNDNRTAEFEHSLETEEDLLDVRNSILESYQDGETTPVSVKLGLTYPSHSFAVDPAPVGGTFRTATGGTVSVEADGATVDACPVSDETKVLNYSAEYNYLQPSPTLVYENTLLYSDYGDANRVMISDQALVQGDQVNLIALRGNYSENGIGVTDFQPRAGQYRSTPTDDPTIETPTRLSESEWERLLEDEVEHPDNVTVQETANGRILQVELSGAYDVRCGIVGANAEPEGGPRKADPGTEINPAGPGQVSVENFSYDSSAGVIRADFNNTADADTNITKARIAFYYTASNNKPPSALTIDGHVETFTIGGSLQSLDTPIRIPANDVVKLTFRNADAAKLSSGDYFIAELEFENGKKGTYFIFAPQ